MTGALTTIPEKVLKNMSDEELSQARFLLAKLRGVDPEDVDLEPEETDVC